MRKIATLIAVVLAVIYYGFVDTSMIRGLWADQPSTRDIENAVREKNRRIAQEYERNTQRTAPQVTSSVDVVGCRPYVEDFLCELKISTDVEGRESVAPFTMRLMKTAAGWVERVEEAPKLLSEAEVRRRFDQELSGGRVGKPQDDPSPQRQSAASTLAEIPANSAMSSMDFILKDKPIITDNSILLNTNWGKFEFASPNAKGEVIQAFASANAGDCLSLVATATFNMKDAADIQQVFRCRE